MGLLCRETIQYVCCAKPLLVACGFQCNLSEAGGEKAGSVEALVWAHVFVVLGWPDSAGLPRNMWSGKKLLPNGIQ